MKPVFMVGTNFSDEQLKYIGANNDVIREVYGSLKHKEIQGVSLPTARPDFRIPNTSVEHLRQFINDLHAHGVTFNYTLNASNTDVWYVMTKQEIFEIFYALDRLKVDRVTIAHPIPLMYIEEFMPSFKVELSTIMGLYDVDAIRRYAQNPYIDKVCLSIYANRDFGFLKALKVALESLKRSDFHAELLSNEFCNINGVPCTSFYRAACYEVNSIIHDNPKSHDNFPKNQCTASRNSGLSWVKAPFISPYDIPYYQCLGYNHFKISGRTYSFELWKKTIDMYLHPSPEICDLLQDLWGAVSECDYHYNVSIKRLKNEHFIENFPKDDACYRKLCNSCGYCHRIYSIIMKDKAIQ